MTDTRGGNWFKRHWFTILIFIVLIGSLALAQWGSHGNAIKSIPWPN
ncbi:hypothetical protein KKF61_02780 [Patescibacteria group bacterium]|nr:hypothetical protein [Patescibacteria group bacterium]